jgi:hypothetical protein
MKDGAWRARRALALLIVRKANCDIGNVFDAGQEVSITEFAVLIYLCFKNPTLFIGSYEEPGVNH